jgi:hypothetical protein
MPPKNDIAIGPDKWISWISFDSDCNLSDRIDSLFDPAWYFWQNLETECVAQCCGIAAFDFYPENIFKAAKGLETGEILTTLKKIKSGLEQLDEPVIVVSKLNQYFAKPVFISLLNHIIDTLEQKN